MTVTEKIGYRAAGNHWSAQPVIVVRPDAEAALPAGALSRLIEAVGPQREDTLDFAGWRDLAGARGALQAAAVTGVLAVVMQRTLYWPVAFCAVGAEGAAVFETRNREVGRIAARRALDVVAALAEGRPAERLRDDVAAALAAFQKRSARMTPAYDALMLARRAEERGIGWTSVEGSTFVRLGAGRHSKMLRGSESSDTSLLAKRLAKKKTVTNAMLSEAGIPVPAQRRVTSLRGALRAYLALGREVVVKPSEGNQGKGVTIRPATALQLARAFRQAREVSRSVVIERFAAGEEYRLLVVGGRFRAAAQRRPAAVVGDGRATIRELVARVNADPARAPVPHGRLAVRLPIAFDAAATRHLARQGLDPESVPAAGRRVEVNGTSNVSRGGDTVDRTDDIHPQIRDLAERAARILDIDLCGIDFITPDPTRPTDEVGGAVCEVNTQPGLSLHLHVSEGRSRDVAADYLDVLYPSGTASRVPVVVVATGDGSGPPVTQIAAAAAAHGLRLGVACDAAIALPGSAMHLPGAEAIAWEDRIDAALVVVPARRIDRAGLGLDRVDLAVLPPGSRSGRAARVAGVLDRAAGGRTLPADAENLVPRLLAALGAAERPPIPALVGVRDLPAAEPDARRVAFAGDIGFGEAYRHYPACRDLQRLLDRRGYDHCVGGVRHLVAEADMAIGNLEVPLAPRVDARLRGRKKFLGWCEPQRTLRALVRAGFGALSLANNHAMDCGALGLAATAQQLGGAGITPFGAGRTEELAARPIVRRITAGGRTRSLVIFAAFEARRRYERAFNWYATGAGEGVGRLDPARIAAQIAALRAELDDPLFVAFPHWGLDYKEVTDSQRQAAAALVEAGVDAIIGHGTHACQRIDLLGGVPVIYGLGNFVWNTPGSGFHKFDAPPFGLVAELVLGRSDGFVLRLYPIVTDNAVTRFRNRPVDADEFARAAAAILPDGHPVAPLGEAGTLHLALDIRGGTETGVVERGLRRATC